MRLNTLIRRVEKVQSEILPIVRKACEGEERTIVDLNRAQLARGENAEGVLMNGGEYSEHYAAFRRRKGLPTDRVYLLLGGDLQDKMRVEFSETGFSVVTDDWKQWMVEYARETGSWPPGDKPHYGPVFGLDEVSRGMLMWRIRPRVAVSIRNRLLKG
jgi:hypothetical protein